MNELHQFLNLKASPRARAWLDEAMNALGARWDRNTFLNTFAGATLRLGRDLDEIGRAVLLLLAAERSPAGEYQALVEDCYLHGENRERQAVMHALPLLPGPERFVSLAVEACRTSVQPVFESIACENPYPSSYFPEASFNQMVLKALHVGAALERVVGLAGRLNPELSRMASAYASERAAAGRSVPDDIARFILTGSTP